MNKEGEDRFLYAMEQVEDGAPLKDYMDYDDIIEALVTLENIIRARRAPPRDIPVVKEVSNRDDCTMCSGRGEVIASPGVGAPYTRPCGFCGGSGKMGLPPEQN